MSMTANLHNIETVSFVDLYEEPGRCINFVLSDKAGNSVTLFLNDTTLASVVQACKTYAEKRAVPAVSYWEHLTTAVPAQFAATDYATECAF